MLKPFTKLATDNDSSTSEGQLTLMSSILSAFTYHLSTYCVPEARPGTQGAVSKSKLSAQNTAGDERTFHALPLKHLTVQEKLPVSFPVVTRRPADGQTSYGGMLGGRPSGGGPM